MISLLIRGREDSNSRPFLSVAKRSIQLSYAHIIFKDMPQTGIEPVREYKSRRILSPVRLPVPPLRHNGTNRVNL